MKTMKNGDTKALGFSHEEGFKGVRIHVTMAKHYPQFSPCKFQKILFSSLELFAFTADKY